RRRRGRKRRAATIAELASGLHFGAAAGAEGTKRHAALSTEACSLRGSRLGTGDTSCPGLQTVGPATGRKGVGRVAPSSYAVNGTRTTSNSLELLVGSRTGAVPLSALFQLPPHRTARPGSPYAALLSASRHGLCDLSAG